MFWLLHPLLHTQKWCSSLTWLYYTEHDILSEWWMVQLVWACLCSYCDVILPVLSQANLSKPTLVYIRGWGGTKWSCARLNAGSLLFIPHFSRMISQQGRHRRSGWSSKCCTTFRSCAGPLFDQDHTHLIESTCACLMKQHSVSHTVDLILLMIMNIAKQSKGAPNKL